MWLLSPLTSTHCQQEHFEYNLNQSNGSQVAQAWSYSPFSMLRRFGCKCVRLKIVLCVIFYKGNLNILELALLLMITVKSVLDPFIRRTAWSLGLVYIDSVELFFLLGNGLIIFVFMSMIEGTQNHQNDPDMCETCTRHVWVQAPTDLPI